MAAVTGSAWLGKRSQGALTVGELVVDEVGYDTGTVSRRTRRPGRQHERNKLRHGASSTAAWYLSAVVVTCLALFTAYISHATLKNLRILSKELRETSDNLGNDGRSQLSAKATSGTGHNNETSLSTDDSSDQTDGEGGEPSLILSTEDDNQSGSISLRGDAVKKILSPLSPIKYVVMSAYRLTANAFEAIKRLGDLVVTIGESALMLTSVTWNAVRLGLIIASVQIALFFVSSLYFNEVLDSASRSVVGRGLALLLQAFWWIPHASLLFSYFLLAAHQAVVKQPRKHLLSRALGIFFAYLAYLNIAELLPTSLPDTMSSVSLSSLSYSMALIVFLVADSLRPKSARLFFFGTLTIFTLYVVAQQLISAALLRLT